MSIVVPAVLPSSREDLEQKLALFARIPNVRRVQVDVVDGRFASPASWPYTAPAEFQRMVDQNELLPRLDSFEYEIDLMCIDVERAAAAWLSLGATRLTFHAESARDLPRMLAAARGRFGAGILSFGLALNVTSDLALIEPCLKEISYVQFMGIARIGRQGQPFDPRVLEKVRIFHERHPEVSMQVDGGVSLESGRQLVALGVSQLVVGSGILRAADPAAALAALEDIRSPYGV